MVLILLFPYAIESIENQKQKNKKILFRLNRNENRRKSQRGEKKGKSNTCVLMFRLTANVINYHIWSELNRKKKILTICHDVEKE